MSSRRDRLSQLTNVARHLGHGEIAAQSLLLLDTALNVSSLGEEQAGELYIVGLGGTVQKIIATPVASRPRR